MSRLDRGPSEEAVLNPYFTDERLIRNAVMRAEQAEASLDDQKALDAKLITNLQAERDALREALTIGHRLALQTQWADLTEHLEPFSSDLKPRDGGEE